MRGGGHWARVVGGLVGQFRRVGMRAEQGNKDSKGCGTNMTSNSLSFQVN